MDCTDELHRVRERRGSLYQTVRVGSFEDQGRREKMEDVHGHTLWEDLIPITVSSCDASSGNERASKRVKTQIEKSNTKVSFFVVCDGHGGKSAANFVYDKLFSNILSQPCFFSDPEFAISLGFQEIDQEYLQYATENDQEAGTTVTMALIIGSTLFVANVGDSEAVICTNGQACVLTEKHTLSNPDEMKRVEQWRKVCGDF